MEFGLMREYHLYTHNTVGLRPKIATFVWVTQEVRHSGISDANGNTVQLAMKFEKF